MGHAGTLDPLASGLMLIGVGEGTKDLTRYLKLPKTYEAEILIGERRSTGDMEGEVLEELAVSELAEAAVYDAVHAIIGTHELPVPIFSAVKRGGTPLYKRARKNADITDVPVRRMEVRSAALLAFRIEHGRAYARVRFDVASGVYIRSLAEEIGRMLGYPATIFELRRLSIGDFDVTDARSV